MKNKKGSTIFILFGLLGLILGVWVRVWTKKQQKSVKKWKESSDKYYLYTNVLAYWISKKQKGKSVGDYLQQHGVKRIAIYGMGFLGERLLDELKDSSVEAVYAIDQNSDTIWVDVEVRSLEEELPEVDAIVVTALYYFDTVEKFLKEKTDCRIMSLEDILCEM